MSNTTMTNKKDDMISGMLDMVVGRKGYGYLKKNEHNDLIQGKKAIDE